LSQLEWSGLTDYYTSPRDLLRAPDTGTGEMFVKGSDRLTSYWVLMAGHAVWKLLFKLGQIKLVNWFSGNISQNFHEALGFFLYSTFQEMAIFSCIFQISTDEGVILIFNFTCVLRMGD
jgi:hypothetical protein